MDLAIVAALIKLGGTAWDAYCADGAGRKEIETLASALALAGQTGKGRGKSAEVEAQHLAMVLAAFGRAYARQWADTRQLAPSRWFKRFFDSKTRDYDDDIATRLRTADLQLITMGDREPGIAEVQDIDSLIGDPVATSYYRELWRVLTHPALTDDDAAPVLDVDGAGKRAFERDFRLAYRRVFTSPAGQAVRSHALSLGTHRVQIIRECLAADLAGWDERHVFGNVVQSARRDQLLPFLPLGEMYIEPDGAVEGANGNRATPRPILSMLHEALSPSQAPHVTVVKADFGRGKSLTARRLACDLAFQYLTDALTPSRERWLPIFVRCADDATAETLSLDGMVRSAIKRHAQDIGLSLDIDDPACALPDDGQRVLIVLDGLDEVVLGQRALEGLFKHLRDKATARRHVLVMSRPGVLPDRRELKAARLIELCPLRADDAGDGRGGQIPRWLDAWNRLATREQPITLDAVKARGLIELAATPILLFMIAHTWDRHPADAAPSHARLYETFFAQIAQGKHAHDADHHPTVHAAATELHRRLIDRGDIGASDTPADAMLWLLARLAWRDRQKAWKQRIDGRVQTTDDSDAEPEPLTRRDVTNLIRDELRLTDKAAGTVEIGVLLTLQTDPTAGCDHVHFGHKSFREFLVARYWASRLLRLARGRERDWESHTEHLLEARLLLPEDGSFAFLMQMIAAADTRPVSPFAWTTQLREAVRTWAEDCFNDERQDLPSDGDRCVRDDRRAVLREAALAIGSRISLLDGTPGLQAKTPWVMRSLLAWFWASREPPRIIAPKASLPKILAGVNFREADFRGADLRGAFFDEARLQGARFEGAQLQGAFFERAVLTDAHLAGANLCNAYLFRANLSDADLSGVNLSDAFLSEADLSGADLSGVILHLAYLYGANLHGANLHGANLTNAIYDEATDWPTDFDPKLAGAYRVPPTRTPAHPPPDRANRNPIE